MAEAVVVEKNNRDIMNDMWIGRVRYKGEEGGRLTWRSRKMR